MATVPISAAMNEVKSQAQPSPELLLMAAAQMQKMGRFDQPASEATDKDNIKLGRALARGKR